MKAASTSEIREGDGGGTGRTLASLLLVVHLFFAGLGVFGNYSPSPLVYQVLDRFSAYTRLLNFDLNFTPYHLTHANEYDVDHRIEVLPEGGRLDNTSDWVVLPGEGFRGGEPYKRYQRLGMVWAFQAQGEGDPAVIAQAVGRHFALNRHVRPQRVRVVRHFLQSRDDFADPTTPRRNPDDPSFFSVVYAANTIVSDSGRIDVVRVDEAGQVAQPVTPPQRPRPRKP